jgi:hypothetical protein
MYQLEAVQHGLLNAPCMLLQHKRKSALMTNRRMLHFASGEHLKVHSQCLACEE